MTTEKQQTPLQKHIDYCIRQIALYKDQDDNICHAFLYAKTHAESLLPEEKQMVIDAHEAGVDLKALKGIGEDYFNETFKL